MSNKVPKQLAMQIASESQYSILADEIGISPLAKDLIMSNGVKVGVRKNNQVYLSSVALKVAIKRSTKQMQ